VTNSSQTRTYFSSASRLAKLKRDADNNLDDSNRQLALLKELNKDGRYRDGNSIKSNCLQTNNLFLKKNSHCEIRKRRFSIKREDYL